MSSGLTCQTRAEDLHCCHLSAVSPSSYCFCPGDLMVPNGCWSPSCCIPYSKKGKGYFLLVPHLLSLTSCWSGLWHFDVGEHEAESLTCVQRCCGRRWTHFVLEMSITQKGFKTAQLPDISLAFKKPVCCLFVCLFGGGDN